MKSKYVNKTDETKADHYNDLVDDVNSLDTALGELSRAVEYDTKDSVPFLAQLMVEAVGGGGAYSEWREVYRNTDNDGWEAMPGGRTHDTTNESVYEFSGSTGIGVGSNSQPVVVHPSRDSTGTRRYMFYGPSGNKFLAKITGNASLATNRWKYAWSEVALGASDLDTSVTGGRSGTTSSDYAVNTHEMYHTSTYAWGVHLTGTDYPSGFAARPIGGGGTADTHRYNVVVEMSERVDSSGNIKYTFQSFGSHDGTC